MDERQLARLVERLTELPGVTQAAVWAKVPERARIYVDVKKFNRERCWNLGAGRQIVIESDGTQRWEGTWAGAMTRNWHVANKTFDRVKNCVGGFLDEEMMRTCPVPKKATG